MRKIIRRLPAWCAAVALAAGTLVVAGAPAGAEPSRTGHLYPLAGDSRFLVYSQSHAAKGSRGYEGCASGSPELRVRSRSGHVSTLPVPHTRSGKHFSADADPCDGLQLTGHFLTLEGVGGGRDPMYWWDLDRHTHGKVTLPGSNLRISVVGTVEGGWVFADTGPNSDTATTLHRQGPSGRVTTYARLARFSLFDVRTSAHGLLVGNRARPLRYRPNGSSRVRTLDSPAHAYGSKSCDALTETYAVCETDKYSGSEHQSAFQVSLTPLSGGPTITDTRTFGPGSDIASEQFGTAGPHGIVDLVFHKRTPGVNLRSVSTDGTVRSAHGHGATAVVSAYGKIIVGHRGGRLTSQGSVTGRQHTLTVGR